MHRIIVSFASLLCFVFRAKLLFLLGFLAHNVPVVRVIIRRWILIFFESHTFYRVFWNNTFFCNCAQLAFIVFWSIYQRLDWSTCTLSLLLWWNFVIINLLFYFWRPSVGIPSGLAEDLLLRLDELNHREAMVSTWHWPALSLFCTVMTKEHGRLLRLLDFIFINLLV